MNKRINGNSGSDTVEILLTTPYFNVVKQGNYYRIDEGHAINGAVIVPVFDNGDILMLHHFRNAIGQTSIELPRGGANEGEPPEQNARRELEEETGIKAEAMDYLGMFYCNNGIMPGAVVAYRAHIPSGYFNIDKSDSINLLEDGEAQSASRFSQEKIFSMLREGEITDGFTLSALALMILPACKN